MELLDIDLVLDPDGHLTDIGASVLADGQGALLPPAVARHADGCATCLARVGDAALAALEAHDTLAAALEASVLAAPARDALAAQVAPTAARCEVGERAEGERAEGERAVISLVASEPAGPTAEVTPLPWWAVLTAAVLSLVGVGMSTSVWETAAVGVSVVSAVPVLARTLLVGVATPGFSLGFERAALAGAVTLWVTGLALGWLATRGRHSRQGEGS